VDALFPLGNTRMLSRLNEPAHYAMPAAAMIRYARGCKSALAFAYPFVAHLAVVRNSMALLVVALALLIIVPMLPALTRGSVAAWTTVPAIAAGLWWVSRSTHATLPLYIAPILVPGFMAGVFGSSLLPGQTPVIEQLIRVMEPGDHGGVPEETVWSYARTLTRAWTILFVTIAATNLGLGLLAEPDGLLRVAGVEPPLSVANEVWSLFANVIGYLLVAAFFVIEYAYRRQRFPRQPYRNILDFFLRVLAAMPRLVSNAAGPRR
jgi:uncharacterized membrane protein